MAAKPFFQNDEAQIAGTAMLAVLLLVATIMMGLLWIVFSPSINTVFDFFNQWAQGTMFGPNAPLPTKQSHDSGVILFMIWTALPALSFIGIVVNTYIKSNILKGLR